MSKRQIGTIVLLILAMVIGAGGFIYISTIIHKSNQILSELEGRPVDMVDHDEDDGSGLDPELFLQQCETSGNEVVELQKKYAESVKSIDGLEGSELENTLNQQKELVASTKTHFKDEVTMPPMWYEGNNYDITVNWSFEKNYLFDKSSVKSLWICRDEANRILAYATAVFDARDCLFDKFQLVTTSYGNSKIGVTMQNGATESGVYDKLESEKYANSIKDMAEKNNVGPSHTLTEKEKHDKADAFDARDALREEYEKEQSKGGDK